MNAHVFQQAVQNILRDNSFDREVTRKRSGSLHTKGLWRAPLTGKVFKRKEERKNKRYNCTLLIDCSGSMNEDIDSNLKKSDLAADAALILHPVLLRCGIPTQVVGFNAVLKRFIPFEEGEPHYDRVRRDIILMSTNAREAPWVYVSHTMQVIDGSEYEALEAQRLAASDLAQFDHELRLSKGYFGSGGNGNTSDGWALERVSGEMEDLPGLHIVIVLSDGCPGPVDGEYLGSDGKYHGKDYFDLKKMVQSCLKRGFLFVGIGIDDTSVQNYYPKQFCSVLKPGRKSEKLTGHAVFDVVAKQLRKHVYRA